MINRIERAMVQQTCAITVLTILASLLITNAKPAGDYLKPATPGSHELKELRTRHSKTFQNANGTRTWSASTASVHYQDEQALWQDIDTEILPIATGPFAYGMTRNSYQSFFSRDLSKRIAAKFQTGKWSVSFGVKGGKKGAVEAEGNTITYRDALGSADLRFTAVEAELREEIIIHEQPATAEWVFELDMKGVRLEKGESGTLDFVDIQTGERVWFMPKPFMFDAAEARSEAVSKELVQRAGRTWLVVKAEPQWLADSARVYPITVDPTWSSATPSADTYVSSVQTTTNKATLAYMRSAGSGYNEGTCQALIKWDMTGAPAASTVDNAANSCSVSARCVSATAIAAYNVGCHKVTGSWSESTTWSLKPTFNATAFATTSVGASSTVYSWSWNGRNNIPDGNGVLLYLNNTWAGTKNWDTKDSANIKPSISINYITASVPSSPSAANPTGETTSQITWNWTDNSNDETGFRIYDASSGGTVKATLSAGVTTWTETSGLTAGTRYNRWVCAYNGAGESARTALPSAMAAYPATWHPSTSTQTLPNADSYIASGSPDNSYASAPSVIAGYTTTSSLLIRRGMVQFDQSSLPTTSLRRAGAGRAALQMYTDSVGSTTAYTVTAYRITSDWDESNAKPTWNTHNASKEASVWASTSVSGAAGSWFTWSWDPFTKGMPNNNRGLMFLAQNETANTYAKSFVSKDTTASQPRMSMDYYLPVNPGWVTQLLVLGPVGGNDMNSETYLSGTGVAEDENLYGNSTKTYGTKTWTAYNGNVSEDGFSNYAWDLGTTGLNFGENNCALFNLYVNSSVAAGNCYLRCGSDDGVRLIVNDAIVGTDDIGRGWAREQSVFGPFSLNAGWNRVLIKVRNGTGGFGLKGVRFSNADATVWSGSTLTFAVDDTTAPSTPTALTVSGVTSDVWQNSVSSPTFSWTSGTDTQGTGEGVSGVRGQKYYLGTSSSGTPDTFQTGTSRAPGAQVDGTYYFKVDTIDYALNESSVETFIFKYDGTKPTNPSATCSDGLASGVWRTTSAPTFTLSGASDATSGLKATGSNARYKYYFGTSASGTPDTGTDSTAISPTLSGDGTYYLRVQTQDDAGNWSDPETVFVYTYAVPPSITSQPSNQIACEGSTATFSVTGSGPDLAYSWMRKGSGWGSAWSVTGSGGSFRASSTDNNSGDSACTSFGASDINSPSGNAFGMWGGASGDTAATRTFSALSANQTASIDFDNGNADSGRKVGFSLQTASGTDLLQFYFLGGQGNYKYNDGTEKDTGISFRRTGLRVQFVLGTANTYTLIVTPCGGTAAYFSGSYASGSIEKLALFNQNTTGGNEYNAYFNNFAIGEYLDNADNYSGDYGGLDYGDQPVASGNGSSTYTTPALSASDNGSQYAVAVWNPYGQVISTTATLTVNPTPSGVGTNLTRFPGGGSVKVRIADLQVTNSVASLGDPAHGTAMKDSTFIYYLPDANDDNADSFTYTTEALGSGCARTATISIQVVDSIGAATGITNASGTISLSFAAIPGYRYDVQRATDVNFTQNMTVLVSTNTPTDGLFMVEDPNPPTPEAYYRLKYPGTP